LTKNWDALEIRIPPSGFKASMLFTGGFAIAWNSVILLGTIATLAQNLFLTLFFIPFWSAGFFLMYQVLLGLFGDVRLYINQQQIVFTQELFGFQFRQPRSSPRESISKLVYIPRHLTKDSEDNRTTVPAKLEIWAGVQKYQLGAYSGFIQSEAELAWLAHELSDWLGIPLTHD